MDPITALQVASAIIGIVDFGTRLLSETYEIYQSSGHTERAVALSTLSDELNGLGQQLQGRLQSASGRPSSVSDKTLQSLSARCVEASAKLHLAIRDLQASPSGSSRISTAANSFAAALKAVWKKSEIESLKEELTEIRSQITIAALISVWEETKHDGQRHMDLKDRLDRIANKLDSHDDTARQFARELSQMTADKENRNRKHTDLADILWRMDWKSWAASHEGNLFTSSQSASHTDVNGVPIWMEILGSISFRELDLRKEAIPKAYASTYSWIFRDSQTDENGEKLEWSSFPAWLKQRDETIYWITGKPGSGKSTLTKYIIESPELQSHLQEYAGDLPCLQAGFFFWNPGSKMETSREGLLRTLLHQCLQARPDLIPAVTPRRWTLYSLLAGEAMAPAWTWKELKESFEILCSFHGKDFRMALFIDGLDEFSESENSPDVLISWIRDTATRHGIKICVSSRPWNVFADAFKREPSLTMQNLSKRDIEYFVRTEFDNSIAFQELKEVFHDDTTAILKEIIEKAQGVFLWVNLVVRNLLSTLVDTPSLPYLKQKLAEIPGDIVGLYSAIWRSIPAERQCRASKILQICLASWGTCETEIMWLATEDRPDPQAFLDEKARVGIQSVMKRVVDGHTRGICELTLGSVHFLHRRAGFVDYVKKKLQDNPSLLVPRKNRVSILKSAIFPSLESLRPLVGVMAPYLVWYVSFQEGWLEIIRFILETSPHRYDTAVGVPIYEALLKCQKGEGDREPEWHQQVLELLEKFGYSSRQGDPASHENPASQGNTTPQQQNTLSRKKSTGLTLLKGLKQDLRANFGKFRKSKRERRSTPVSIN
ncbi:hypothetical protein ACHAPT_013081 [Fusarium lateritium]